MMCEYCEESKLLLDDEYFHKGIGMCIVENKIQVNANSLKECAYIEATINYCPMCGRKLEESE